MIIRRLDPDDLVVVEHLHGDSGFSFKFPDLGSPLIETGCLIIDASGEPLVASVAKRSPEIVLAMRRDAHPAVKVQGLRLVHEFMRKELSAKGYHEANCFLPPEIEKSYGRHLRKIFGWERSWQGYTLRG